MCLVVAWLGDVHCWVGDYVTPIFERTPGGAVEQTSDMFRQFINCDMSSYPFSEGT